MLNKFAVVPEHFILATREFRPQTHLLEPADLAATWACIEAYHNSGGQGQDQGQGQGLFAFFNSGEHSGASQPHRHLQLLPVERMRDGLAEAVREGDGCVKTEWQVLADRLAGDDADNNKGVELPFATFGERLGPDETGETLHAIYLRLYRQACAAVDAAAAGINKGKVSESAETTIEMGGEAHISYNLAMTRQAMVIAPRTAEGATVKAAGGGDSVGKLALNGTVLAGTALVKNEAEWDALRNDPAQLLAILGRIGVPPAAAKGTRSWRRTAARESGEEEYYSSN